MQVKAKSIRSLYEDYSSKRELPTKEEIVVEGWVKTNRNSGKIGFIELHDGTCFKNLQLVYTSDLAAFDGITHFNLGAAIEVKGLLVLTPEMKQPFELQVKEVKLLGDVSEDYPLQKKKVSFEFLRDEAYLRPRTNTFDALYRVRSVLAMGVHTYFQDHNFVYVHTPEITANDAEGAGSVFTVTTDAKDPINDFYGRRAS